MRMLLAFAQTILFIAIAPLLSGLISKIKNNVRMRKGASVFQPYYNLIKLFSKEEVISDTASWIFKITPVVVFASVLAATILISDFLSLNSAGNFLALIFIFALGRFFMTLAALDTGSSFGGMGSSREMFISSLVEPVLCLTVFAYFLNGHALSFCSVISAIALFLVTLAETSRIPVDNQETHLELTMIHEAMLLEYSGKSLGLIELSSHLKQMILFYVIAWIVVPVNFSEFLFLGHIAVIIAIVIAVALVEVALAKMRLFRVTDFLGFAFVLGMLSVVCGMLGA